MDETAARQTLLVRAYERAASPHWGDADREWATQGALHIVGEQASDDAFIARRAALAIERLRERDPAVPRLLAAVTWRRWVGRAPVIAALALGLALDAVGTQGRVNLLDPPLLALIAWNLFVYALLAVRGMALLARATPRVLGPLAGAIARAAHAIADPGLRHATGPGGAFLLDWAQAARHLTGARVGRVLHTAAIAFALGALASLYLRGLAFEYRAGWESTFLDAREVQALLAAVLGPAARLTGIALPDAPGFAALRFPESAGVIAAPWLHLYAVTVALVVLLPRLLLALADRWVEARWTRHFRLPLDEPYFRGLTRALHWTRERVCVLPFSMQLSPQATLGVRTLLAGALGSKTMIDVAPTIAFGDEDRVDAARIAGATIAAPCFALAATPEPENHGALLVRVRAALPRDARLLALVDEAGFERRFGAARTAERRRAWRRLLADSGCPAVIADFEQPDVSASEREVMRALEAQAAERA